MSLLDNILNEDYGTQKGRDGKYSKGTNNHGKLSPSMTPWDAAINHAGERADHDSEYDWFFNKAEKSADDSYPDMAYEDLARRATISRKDLLDFTKDLADKFPGTQVIDRIKSRNSSIRKASDPEMGWAGLDDAVGASILTDTPEQAEEIVKILYKSPKVATIHDFTSGAYKGYNVAFKSPVGTEIQIMTLRNFIFKDIYGHIIYEILRDIDLACTTTLQGTDKVLSAIKILHKVEATLNAIYEYSNAREGTHEKVSLPDVNDIPNAPHWTDDEKELCISFVRPETKERARGLLYGTIKPDPNMPVFRNLDLKGLL